MSVIRCFSVKFGQEGLQKPRRGREEDTREASWGDHPRTKARRKGRRGSALPWSSSTALSLHPGRVTSPWKLSREPQYKSPQGSSLTHLPVQPNDRAECWLPQSGSFCSVSPCPSTPSKVPSLAHLITTNPTKDLHVKPLCLLRWHFPQQMPLRQQSHQPHLCSSPALSPQCSKQISPTVNIFFSGNRSLASQLLAVTGAKELRWASRYLWSWLSVYSLEKHVHEEQKAKRSLLILLNTHQHLSGFSVSLLSSDKRAQFCWEGLRDLNSQDKDPVLPKLIFPKW